MRLQSLHSLKNILSTGDVFERAAIYAKLVDGTMLRANLQAGHPLKRVSAAIEPIIKKEEEILQVADELKGHVEKVEQLIQGRRLDSSVNMVATRRIAVEKATADVLESFAGSVRTLSSAFQNFRMVSENSVDLLDVDQVNLLEQTYVAAFGQLNRIRQVCTDAGKQYPTSPTLSKLFNSISDFCHSLFTEVVINPGDLALETANLKDFNGSFHPAQRLFDEVRNEVENSKNEGLISRKLQEFAAVFNRVQEEHSRITSKGVESVLRLFLSNNLEELHDGFDYLAMVRELFAIFGRILDERVRVGHADPNTYQELASTLSDKPDPLISLANQFRTTFS